METMVTYTETFRKNYDPTHTTVLRNAFAKAMKTRFMEITNAIKKGVDNNDCFGLKEKIHNLQVTTPTEGAFAYPLSQTKVEEFMRWLERQVNAGLLTVREMNQIGASANSYWTNLYLFDSYKRGVMRARDEMRKAGMDVPSIDESGGIDVILGLPFHLDRLGLIYIRAYNDLKGITDVMSSQISRVLAQGIADGDGPALLAKKLVSTINGTGMGNLAITDTLGRFIPAQQRAILLARTEIIRAHHLATIQEYRNWGVLGITVKGEWKTAGDDRVCDACAALEGKIFTLDEIEGLIPLHPLCRCIALPYIEELKKYEQ
jgi:SPP1 gp7 family putative phage head morphogenesis protein